MKKVAQIITLSEMGGAQKNVYLLSKNLIKEDYDVTVISSGQGDLAKVVKESGCQYIDDPFMVREINLIQDIKNIFYLYKLFKKEGFDIIHCHSSKAGLVARIAARLAGVDKIIYTAHGFVFNEPMSRIKKNVYRTIEYIGGKFGKNIIAVSKKDYDCALEYNLCKEKNLYYIPNAIEEINLKELKNNLDIRKELGIDENSIVFGTVSNFYETKGHRYLIEALKRLYDEGYKFETIFAGEGPTLEEMKILAAGYNSIKFLGYRKDNLDLMNAMDLFILPSVKEGMPYAILEAMAVGTPVLCTRVGALGDIITNKENGIIVEPQDVEQLYKELKNVLDNRIYISSLGEAGKEYVNKNFSFDAFLNKIKEIYNKD